VRPFRPPENHRPAGKSGGEKMTPRRLAGLLPGLKKVRLCRPLKIKRLAARSGNGE